MNKKDMLCLILMAIVLMVGFIVGHCIYKRTGLFIDFKKVMAITIMIMAAITILGMMSGNDEED